MSETFGGGGGCCIYFILKFAVTTSWENLAFGYFVAGGMRHSLFDIRVIVPHSIGGVEEIVFAGEVTDVQAFAKGVGVLDGLAAGSGVTATSVGAGGFFATLFDECSLRWDICGVEIGVTTVGANDDECFLVLWECVFHFVKQVA